MDGAAKRLFVGVKITRTLQADLDNPAPGTKQYFEGEEHLRIVEMGSDKFIGRYIEDGFPVANLTDVSRNICSMLKLIAAGKRIDDGDVEIYSG